MARIGRNDECHCGSGKKYKKCCLTKDKAAESLALAEAQQQPASPEPAAADIRPDPPAPENVPVDLLVAEMNRLWDEFTAADYQRQIELFTELTPDHEHLDAELAVEMLNRIFRQAETHHDFPRFEILIEALREQRPELYRQDAHYYLHWRIEAALYEGRDDDAELLARQLALLAGEQVDVFHWAVDELAYAGALGALCGALRIAWPAVRDSGEVLPLAKGTLASRGLHYEIYDALTRDAADAAMIAACVEFYFPGAPPAGAKRMLEHVRGAVQQTHDPQIVLAGLAAKKRRRDEWDDGWRDDDERDDEGGDEYPGSLPRLSYDFLGYLWREEAMPLAKAEMSREGLVNYLAQRAQGELQSRQSMLDAAMRRPKPKPHRPPLHPLCPDCGTLDQFLTGMIGGMFSHRAHAAAALAEALPAWLRFLDQRGAIDATLHAKVLLNVFPLMDQFADAVGQMQSDRRLAENIRRAWSVATPAEVQ